LKMGLITDPKALAELLWKSVGKFRMKSIA